MKYWLGVVSKEHVMRGVAGGFAQVCHGKRGPLSKMNEGDWLIYYSSVHSMGDKAGLQSFIAAGTIADEDIFEFQMTQSFCPFRRKVRYRKTNDVELKAVKSRLEFTQKPKWGFQLKKGLIEISQQDFEIIAAAMGVKGSTSWTHRTRR